MKKLLILQNDLVLGGIWLVDKILAENLINKDFEVSIVSLRDYNKLEINPRVKLLTINKDIPWTIVRKKEVIKPLLKLSIKESYNLYKKRKEDLKLLNLDYLKLKKYIEDSKPDYILVTHYQLLDAIPDKYLSKTIYEQHNSFAATKKQLDNMRVLFKYKDKVKYVWLTKSTANIANKYFPNNTYIYNPIRFTENIENDVLKNKKLIVVSRISKEKRIDLMIDIVNSIFEDPKYNDWTFEIYGKGDLDLIKNKVDNQRIFYLGETDRPIDVLRSASINLNTSLYEGFSLSILEAAYCYLPTITFNFGESALEEVINNKTGIVVEMNDIETYKQKLKCLMDNQELLKKLSLNAKEFSKKFKIDSFVEEWLKLFKEIE